MYSVLNNVRKFSFFLKMYLKKKKLYKLYIYRFIFVFTDKINLKIVFYLYIYFLIEKYNSTSHSYCEFKIFKLNKLTFANCTFILTT